MIAKIKEICSLISKANRNHHVLLCKIGFIYLSWACRNHNISIWKISSNSRKRPIPIRESTDSSLKSMKISRKILGPVENTMFYYKKAALIYEKSLFQLKSLQTLFRSNSIFLYVLLSMSLFQCKKKVADNNTYSGLEASQDSNNNNGGNEIYTEGNGYNTNPSTKINKYVDKIEETDPVYREGIRNMMEESKKYYSTENVCLEDEKIDSFIGDHSNMNVHEIANLATHKSKNPITGKMQDIPSTKTLNKLITEYNINPNSILNPKTADNVFHIGVQWPNTTFMNNIIEWQNSQKLCKKKKEKALINKKNVFGKAPIHVASEEIQPNNDSRKKTRLVQLLKSDFIDVNNQDQRGNTVVHNLMNNIHKGDLESEGILYTVLENDNIDIDSINNEGDNYLHYMAKKKIQSKKLLRRVMRLARKDKFQILNELNDDHKTVLQVAIESKNDLMTNCLLDIYYNSNELDDINQVDNEGRGALHYAILYQNVIAMNKILIKPDTRIDTRTNENGLSTIHFTIRVALYSFNVNLFREFIRSCKANGKKIDIDIKDNTSEKNTPLIYCIKEAEKNKDKYISYNKDHRNTVVKICKELIDNNAKINEQNELGEFPLYLAIKTDNIKLLKILLDEDDIDVRQEYNGQSMLTIANEVDNNEAYKLIEKLM